MANTDSKSSYHSELIIKTQTLLNESTVDPEVALTLAKELMNKERASGMPANCFNTRWKLLLPA